MRARLLEKREPGKRRCGIAYAAPHVVGYEMRAAAALAPDADWRVVAIPGTPSRPHMWTRFLRLAPDDLDVVAANRAGYGGPLYGAGTRAPVLSFDDQVAALAPLFDRDDGKRTVVVGVSYGGALALKCALEYPHRVAGVVTVSALVTEPRKFVLSMLPLADAPGVRQALPAYLHNARAEVAGRRAQIGPLLDRLADLDCPVTIMHGNLDALVATEDADVLASKFRPGADIDRLNVRGGTHYLELERPRLVYRAVRGVIARAEAKLHNRGPDNRDLSKETAS